MKRSIDGRTLPCPQPVIKVKKAFDEGGFEELVVLVDNKAAVENITRFVENSGNTILSIREENQIHSITIKNTNEKDIEIKPETELNTSTHPDYLHNGNIFINSSTIGSGDQKLGEKLLETFLFTLTEMDDKPKNILIMNSGVKITVERSPSIENLKELENNGVNILVCGACLDYYKIKDNLQVGKISNMYEIASILTAKGNTVTLG